MSDIIRLAATLKEVSYQVNMAKGLSTYPLNDLTNNNDFVSKANCILKTEKDCYAFSQWVSPKRTRSFPYARVYDTLAIKNRITLIPFCKDEGFDGDRDFIQWDTISLMSLLSVYVIIGYYTSAQKSNRPKQAHRHKITDQVFDYRYVIEQINEIENYYSGALHWNIKQIEKLPNIATTTAKHYQIISKLTGVSMHSKEGLDRRISIIKRDLDEFRYLSRQLAQKAQHRENLTTQAKERVIGKKVSISMKNLLGGYYFMTADEGIIVADKCYLIEKKHSARSILPSLNDIKDSLIKMVLFTNIDTLKLGDKVLLAHPVVGLTSSKIKGYMHSNMADTAIDQFTVTNNLSTRDKKTLFAMLQEARINKFGLFITNDNTMHYQENILKDLTT